MTILPIALSVTGRLFAVLNDGSLQATLFSVNGGAVNLSSSAKLAIPTDVRVINVKLSPSGRGAVVAVETRIPKSKGFIYWQFDTGETVRCITPDLFSLNEIGWGDDGTILITLSKPPTIWARCFNIQTKSFGSSTRLYGELALDPPLPFWQALELQKRVSELGLERLPQRMPYPTHTRHSVSDPGSPSRAFTPVHFVDGHLSSERFLASDCRNAAILGALGNQLGLWFADESSIWFAEPNIWKIQDAWYDEGYIGLVVSGRSSKGRLEIYDLKKHRKIFSHDADYSDVSREE